MFYLLIELVHAYLFPDRFTFRYILHREMSFGLDHWETSVVHLSTEGSLWSNTNSLSTPLAVTLFFTVSTKASSFDGLSNIGSTKNFNASGFDQNALINLNICKNSELMAGSQYHQTTRSLLKTRLRLIYYIEIVFVQ